MTARRRILVIGAGTAGCVVAEVLSRDGALDVTVVEAGPDRDGADPTEVTSAADLFRALEVPSRQWTGIEQDRRHYVRGRGVGGSGAINGLLMQTGTSVDWDRWGRRPGCDGWSWSDVATTLHRLSSGASPSAGPLGPADALLQRAAGAVGIDTRRADLATIDGRRNATDMTHLRPARRRDNLGVRTDALVTRVLIEGTTPVGVELATREVLDADLVVVCAGAVLSPGLLRRSGVHLAGIGENLHDHHGVAFALESVSGDAHGPVTSLLGSTAGRAFQLVPLNRTSSDASGGVALLCGVLHQHGRGRVTTDSSGSTLLSAGVDEHDRDELVDAAGLLRGVLHASGHDDAMPGDTELGAWAQANPAPYFHAAGTCRMGEHHDERAVVDATCQVHRHPGLYVIDASVFPDQPDVNPYLPTVAVASIAAERLRQSLG